MTQMPVRNYRISNEVFEAIENEFKAETIAKKYIETKDPKLFKEYGKKLMDLTYELGTKAENVDRIYEMVQIAANQTGGEVRFPYEPQRFIEIAFLSVHFMPILRVRISNQHEEMFTVDEKHCGIYKHLKEGLNEKELESLPCQDACIGAATRIFELLKMDDVTISQIEKMPETNACTFSAKRK